MKHLFAIFIIANIFVSCGSGKSSKQTEQPETAAAFVKLYHPLNIPVTVDSSNIKTFGDTLSLTLETISQFVPDTTFQSFTNNKKSVVAHPAGIIQEDDFDYLLTRFSAGKTQQLIVFVFDKEHKFITSFNLLSTNYNDGYAHSVDITSEPTFIIRKQKTAPDNSSLYTRTGYAYNNTIKSFAEVMKDSNEDQKKSEDIFNPIDTLPSTNKFSGEYATDNKNFISIRDGKNATSYFFFIHFEKNKGDCTGELKGEMNLTNINTAIYQQNGDACVIRFSFTKNAVKIKEDGNCGNHRGINCLFDFTFKKKKSLQKANPAVR